MVCNECERLIEGYVNSCPICNECEHICRCKTNFIDGYDNCYGD